jgi:capsular exopolysaccharide synthesis family protein
MAAEFAEDSSQSQMRRSQKTSEFLGAQTEETKARLQDAEERLRDFVQASGNLFAGQDVTLDDTKLAQLKSELAKIESDRIAKQTRFELTKKYTPDALGEVLDDGGLKQYQQQIGTLKREKAALETTLTPKNEKVVRLDAQLKVVEKQYENEVAAVVTRLRTDYEAALRHETLLNGAYASQSQRVGAQAGKAAQYNALKREVDTLRQMYQAILMQSNQNGLSNSVPMSPIRVVEASFPPEAPYSPVPVLNISIGTMFGLVFAGGLVFLRERMDSSIKSTGTARRLINVPELGIIPGLGEPKKYARTLTKYLGRKHPRALEGHGSSSLDAWNEAPSLVAESFRGALASIIRNETHGKPQRVILVTSPGMGEGKSTVVENLGIALAESGRKVLLVDGDFRRPVLHERFNLPNDRALIDLVKEESAFAEANFESFCVSSSIPGLSVLPNRVTGANVSSMLYSPRLRTILRNLWDKYEMVLVDAPPILAVADARILAPMMDAVILVLRYGVTSQEGAREAHQRIQEDRIPLLGTILTDWNASKKNNYYYGYSNDKG